MISTPGKLSHAAAELFCKTETNAPGVCFRAIIWPQARLLAGARQGRSAATCSRSPHCGRNRTVARLDVGSPARILAEVGDRRQCCNLLTALDDEGLVAKALADCCRLGGRIHMRAGQQLEQDYRSVARDSCSSAVKDLALAA